MLRTIFQGSTLRRSFTAKASSSLLSKFHDNALTKFSVPKMVQGYEKIPKSLDDEDVMVNTLDLQLTEIVKTFKATAEAALILQGY